MGRNENQRGREHAALLFANKGQEVTIFSDEYQLPVSEAAFVSFTRRFSGVDPSTNRLGSSRLALRIGSDWYISDPALTQISENDYGQVTVDVSQVTFGVSTVSDDGGPIKPAEFNVKLPVNGPINAFGVFLDSVYGRVRFENFTISNATPGDPSS